MGIRNAERRRGNPCGELLDPMGVPGSWFRFGIGVSRTQYIYAIAVPLLAILVARTIHSMRATEPEPANI